MNSERPLRSALVMVLVGAALGIGSNVLHPHPIPWKPEQRPQLATLDDPVPAENGNSGESGDPPGSSGMDVEASPGPGDPATLIDEKHPPNPAGSNVPVPDFKPMRDGFGKGEKVPMTQVAPETDPASSAGLYADIPESEFPVEVHMAKAKQLYDRGGLLVLDARERSEYEDGHIKNAVNADAEKVVADLAWMEKTAADPRPILVYCDGGDCELSLDLGMEISRTGHRKVLVFLDGYPAWKDAGYPVETGDTP